MWTLKGLRIFEFRVQGYNAPYVDRIWLWVYHNKVPTYPIFHLLKGDCRVRGPCVCVGSSP